MEGCFTCGGCVPHGGHRFDGGRVSKKIVGWGGPPSPAPTMGNPVNRGCFLTLGNTECSQTLTKQTNAKFNVL